MAKRVALGYTNSLDPFKQAWAAAQAGDTNKAANIWADAYLNNSAPNGMTYEMMADRKSTRLNSSHRT